MQIISVNVRLKRFSFVVDRLSTNVGTIATDNSYFINNS